MNNKRGGRPSEPGSAQALDVKPGQLAGHAGPLDPQPPGPPVGRPEGRSAVRAVVVGR